MERVIDSSFKIFSAVHFDHNFFSSRTLYLSFLSLKTKHNKSNKTDQNKHNKTKEKAHNSSCVGQHRACPGVWLIYPFKLHSRILVFLAP